MPLIKLLKTSTFRLAVIYLALFAASAITLLAYVYWNTAGFLARQTDELHGSMYPVPVLELPPLLRHPNICGPQL